MFKLRLPVVSSEPLSTNVPAPSIEPTCVPPNVRWSPKSNVPPALATSRAVSPVAPLLKLTTAPAPPPVPPSAVIVAFPACAR